LPAYRVLTGPDDDAFCRRVSEALASDTSCTKVLRSPSTARTSSLPRPWSGRRT